MRKRTTIDAGAIVYVIESSVKRKQDDARRSRARKSRPSSANQKLKNQIKSQNWLELQLAVNFPAPGSAHVLTLSFDNEHLPKTRKQTQRKLYYFINNTLRKACEAAGLPRPRAIWAIEVLSSANNRWHVHMVIESIVPLEMIRKCWRYGSNIECRELRVDDEKNHESLARYLSKESRDAQEWDCKPGLHVYGRTQNCLKPEIIEEIVQDRAQLRAPRTATVLLHERRETAFDEIHVLKYRLPAACFRHGVKRRRRRKH